MANKYQVALRYISSHLPSNDKNVDEAKKVLQELVNLQTPRKPKSEPIEIGDADYATAIVGWEAYCPHCNEEIHFDENYKPTYCDGCGQRIDWSEDEYYEEDY